MTITVPLYDGDPATLQFILDQIALRATDLTGLLYVGSGSPETVITASPPAIYLNRSGGAGTTIYVKESGSHTNTGWIGK